MLSTSIEGPCGPSFEALLMMMMIRAQLTAAAQGLASHLLWILPTFIGKIPEPDSRRDSAAALPGLGQLGGDLEPADDRSQVTRTLSFL